MARLSTSLSVLSFVVILTVVDSAKKSSGFDFNTDSSPDSKKKLTITEEVWFDVLIKNGSGDGDDWTGRFVVGVFGDTCPMTAINFISLARGYSRKNARKLHYKNTLIHRVVPDFVIQMGDVDRKDGMGGRSIFGDTFVDENFDISHQAAGYVAMANHGTDTNSSQFYILLNKARWLDGKHVVFGKVIKGMAVVRRIAEEKADRDSAVPYNDIKIVDCGVVGISTKYSLTPEQSLSNEDL